MRRMNWKGFLLRLSITFVLIWVAVSAFVSYSQRDISDFGYSGFPLEYSEVSHLCMMYGNCEPFHPANLVLDIAVWMAVSLAMVLLSYKIIR
jgi:hypothetical protein